MKTRNAPNFAAIPSNRQPLSYVFQQCMNDGATKIIEGGCYHRGGEGDQRNGHRKVDRKYIILYIALQILAFIVLVYRKW